uniref:Uncharacterized protein n=1 Tax=Anguilla anguilla TaxID=7936 RepID=A0A0E9S3N4_ANGAN
MPSQILSTGLGMNCRPLMKDMTSLRLLSMVSMLLKTSSHKLIFRN